jgi:hypothetical protein
MKKVISLLSSLFLVLCFVPHLTAAGIIYGTAYQFAAPASLYTIDASNGTPTLVGVTGFGQVGGIDFNPFTGTLYGIGMDLSTGASQLITINTTTGVATAVGPTGIGGPVQDISFRSDGTLFAFGAPGGVINLYTIDLSSGAATLVGPSSSANGGATAFDSSNTLYHLSFTDIQTLNQTTGAATSVGTLTYPFPSSDQPRTNAMDFDPATGILYGSVHTSTFNPNSLVTIDLGTGVVTEVGQSLIGLDGLAVQPTAPGVPDSGSTIALMLGAIGTLSAFRLKLANVSLHRLSGAILLLLLAPIAPLAQAATITWGAPTNITGNADVSTNGSLVGAFNVGDTGVAATTINGVNFQSFAVPSFSMGATVGNFAISCAGTMFSQFSFGSGNPPFSALSSEYQTLLAAATSVGSINAFTLTTSGLMVGAQYEFQWWVNDSNGGHADHSATAGNTVTLTDNATDLPGGLGQFALGTFTADAATQTILFHDANYFGQLNAFQLRQVGAVNGVPETGSTFALLALALGGLVLARWCSVGCPQPKV